jgi:hypothetical protein
MRVALRHGLRKKGMDVTRRWNFVYYESNNKLCLLWISLYRFIINEHGVKTDPVFVEQEPSSDMRQRLVERKVYPDGLESNDGGDETARGDPTSRRSWLSCRCMEEKFWKKLQLFNINRETES